MASLMMNFAIPNRRLHELRTDRKQPVSLVAIVSNSKLIASLDEEESNRLAAESLEFALRLHAHAARNEAAPTAPAEDRLLTVKEASKRLGLTVDWLYGHSENLPFTFRPSPGLLRFSSRGIDEYLRNSTPPAGRGQR
jgi:predicted DNA-binding transcriptional regulator AlpA